MLGAFSTTARRRGHTRKKREMGFAWGTAGGRTLVNWNWLLRFICIRTDLHFHFTFSNRITNSGVEFCNFVYFPAEAAALFCLLLCFARLFFISCCVLRTHTTTQTHTHICRFLMDFRSPLCTLTLNITFCCCFICVCCGKFITGFLCFNIATESCECFLFLY